MQKKPPRKTFWLISPAKKLIWACRRSTASLSEASSHCCTATTKQRIHIMTLVILSGPTAPAIILTPKITCIRKAMGGGLLANRISATCSASRVCSRVLPPPSRSLRRNRQSIPAYTMRYSTSLRASFQMAAAPPSQTTPFPWYRTTPSIYRLAWTSSV